jgi:hypothetical protein
LLTRNVASVTVGIVISAPSCVANDGRISYDRTGAFLWQPGDLRGASLYSIIWSRQEELFIRHVDGSPRICELLEYHLEHLLPKGAWTGLAALSLTPRALAPVAQLPVLEVVSAIHIIADLTLRLGKVVHDYLRKPDRQPLHSKEKNPVP